MPNCFQLTRLSEMEKGAVSLNQIDRELCELLGVEVHPVRYVGGWFDCIGFLLACGKTWAQIWDDLGERADESGFYDHYADMAKMCHYLQNNFTANAWVEIGRRR